MAKVRLENVYKIYPNGVKAVKDFSLNIQDEEFVVFVGPSGCGKSTTLRMIAGLEDISAGRIYIDDAVVNDLEPKDRDISMVFQNYALYPNMTVYDNMAYGLRCHHVKEDEIKETVRNAAEILGITDYLDRKPKELSGGQRQRVALGRAIVRKPKVFLLDEPLSNLDAKLRVQMRSEISKLHERLKTTFIYVTHDQTEAMTMGSQIVVMKDGVIQQVDTPLNLYNHPVNTFVATFLGSPQMNLLEGKLEKRGEEWHFASGPLDIVIPEEMLLQMNGYEDGMEVYLGARPADISLSERGFKTKIELMEQLGNETILYVYLPGREELSIVSSADKNLRLMSGDEIGISFDLQHIHLFDKATGSSLVQANVANAIEVEATREEGTIRIDGFEVDGGKAAHFLEDDLRGLELRVSSSDISFDPLPGSIAEKATIKKVVPFLSYDVVFGTVKGKPLVAKTAKAGLKEGEETTIYIPFEKAEFHKAGRKVYSALLTKEDRGVEVSIRKTRSATILLLPKGRKAKDKRYLVEKREELNDSVILLLKGCKTGEKLVVRAASIDVFEGQSVFAK